MACRRRVCQHPRYNRDLYDLFMDAVLAADEIAINLLQTEAEIQVAANRFKEKSTNGVMTGCVLGCVDGILVFGYGHGTHTPRAKLRDDWKRDPEDF